MDDRELLELAAKAAGFKLNVSQSWGAGLLLDCQTFWSPLTDDGDALRLAVTLSLRVECYTGIKIHPMYSASHVTDVYSTSHPEIRLSESHNGNPCAATRRAIVRAAAEIGRAM